MDNLRIILLIIGCFIVLGIYLWEIFFKSEPRKNSDILDAVDEFPHSPEAQELPVPSIQQEDLNQEDIDNYSAAVANLGSLLAQSRNESLETEGTVDTMSAKEELADDVSDKDLPLQMSVKDYEASMADNDDFDVFAAIEEDLHTQQEDFPQADEINDAEPEVEKELPVNNQVCEELLVLYITSPRHTLFNGLSISKAADAVGMIYGHMNVFHHFGPGKLHSGQPLFSMSNMYEPGSFDLGRMADLRTKGISVFMYSPASIDASVVFELFLNTTQRIAELLGGEIRTANNKLLNSTAIKSLRDKAESFSVSQ